MNNNNNNNKYDYSGFNIFGFFHLLLDLIKMNDAVCHKHKSRSEI